MNPTWPIERSPDVMSGEPVFSGTRVPVATFLDYLAGGHRMEEFLQDFPSVTRHTAEEFLDAIRTAVGASTY